MGKLVATLMAVGLLFTGLATNAAAAPKKKTAKPGLSAAEKAELRKKYLPICIEQFGHRGSVRVFKVHVYSDGRVVCWYRG